VSRAEAIHALVTAAKPDELPLLAGELAQALTVVMARAAALATTAPSPAAKATESVGLLSVQQAAERLGVAPSWLYRHARQLPFTRKLGHRTLRFDAIVLDRWMRSRPMQ
jgi:excisionase family DNA binding protein